MIFSAQTLFGLVYDMYSCALQVNLRYVLLHVLWVLMNGFLQKESLMRLYHPETDADTSVVRDTRRHGREPAQTQAFWSVFFLRCKILHP